MVDHVQGVSTPGVLVGFYREEAAAGNKAELMGYCSSREVAVALIADRPTRWHYWLLPFPCDALLPHDPFDSAELVEWPFVHERPSDAGVR